MSVLSLARCRVTILVYHNISPDHVPKDRILPDSITAADFDRQMQILKEKRFKVLPLKDLIFLLREGRKVPARTVTITFDDGYKSTYAVAHRILQKYSFPACVFLATDFVGREESFPWLRSSDCEDTRPMSWEDAKTLYRQGIEIGSHTASHRFLPALQGDELETEVIRSKEAIRNRLGQEPAVLALPFSYPLYHRQWPLFEKRLLGALRNANFTSCCTMQRGRVSMGLDIVFLPRVPVMRDETELSFYAKALGLYRFTGFPQYLFQRFLKKYRTSEPNNRDATGEVAKRQNG
jgi:peptidoglycan/xylan/chitin deacetylase (PgdA/CDA1 family)